MPRVVVLATASLLGLASCELEQLSDPDSGGGGDGGSHRVVYRVTGPKSADLTYQNENDDTSQEGHAKLPWTYSFQAEDFAFAYVSAQNNQAGTITCTIEIDGVEAESNSSSGRFAICTASGSV
jgi:Mycobacterium membrane protein